jgi:phenylalanyl-tRNA synthetase beta chain
MSEILNRPISLKESVNKLTMAGLEVESIEPAAANFSGVVVGHVVERKQHPDADRLSVCRVDVGSGQVLQIVCGAPNVREGLKVAVVQVGGVLPGEFKIKKSTLRGVESNGMICSANELGLGESGNGIIELSEEATIGQDFREYYQLNDEVMDIAMTPNRGDCLSMFGVAREISALDKIVWHVPHILAVKPTVKNIRGVTVESKLACPRYAGRQIDGLNKGSKTPFWMAERLRRLGQRAIGFAVVDSINYVMLEMGQPMHAFDAEKLDGNLVIRLSKEEEVLTVLGGQRVALKPGTLLVTDQSSILAVAGVMGGEASAVTQETTSIFLESAFFSSEVISQSSKQNGLRSESSYRYERGVDFGLQVQALERVTQLIVDLCGGEVGPIVEAVATEGLPKRDPIVLRQKSIVRYLDAELPAIEIHRMLSSLGMIVEEIDDNSWRVTAPKYRFDIQQEVDLIEELIRLYGYNQVPYKPLIGELIMPLDLGSRFQARLMQAKNTLMERDYCEAVTYSFVEPETEMLLSKDKNEALSLLNPLGKDMSVMRRSLLSGLLLAMRYNLNRQQSRVRLFEQGKCFLPNGLANAVVQEDKLAGVIAGNVHEKQWGEQERHVDFYDIKQDVTQLLCALDLAYDWTSSDHPALHPHQQQSIQIDGVVIGYIGALHPELVEQLDLSMQPFVFELNWSALCKQSRLQFLAFSRFPAIKRDLSLVVNEGVTASEIRDGVCQLATPLLKKVEVFDIYRSSQIGQGKKSISLELLFQDCSRTLVDEEIDKLIQRIVIGLANDFGTQLRG